MDKRWYWLAGFVVIGILLGGGVIYLITRPPRGSPITLLPAPTPAPVTVYVTGKVNKGGLYSLPVGSRINDAIQAAGGFSGDANTEAYNLAQVIEDGQQIDVPGLTTPVPTPAGRIPGSMIMGLVNINTASIEQLDILPGIGLATAEDIVAYRNANGSFTAIDKIMDVPGIGPAKFEAIKDLITVETSP